jgi:hypothetical protein
VSVASSTTPAALGFRVKSGWAAAVLLGGPATAPRVLDHRHIELCDPAVPGSRQPYHAGFGVAQQDARKVRRLVTIVRRCARRAVTAWIREHHSRDHELLRAAVVVGSDVDPDRITNPHIRAHAREGRLFGTVVEDAVRRSGLLCVALRERDLYARAAAELGRSEAQLKRAAAELGRGREAAVAAWLVLA